MGSIKRMRPSAMPQLLAMRWRASTIVMGMPCGTVAAGDKSMSKAPPLINLATGLAIVLRIEVSIELPVMLMRWREL